MLGPRRIAIIAPTFLPYRGGMCIVAGQDASDLASLGHEVDVLVPSSQGDREVNGYRVKSLRTWVKYGNAALVPGVFNECKKYDLVVLHYPFFGGAEPVALARLFNSCSRLVIYYHMDVFGRGLVRAVAAVHSKLIRSFIINSADRILVTSFDYAYVSAVGQLLKSTPDIFKELPPSVDTERFCPGDYPEELRIRYGLDASRKTIIFVGGLDRAHYFKGVDLLIKALAVEKLSNLQAVIIGGGELIEDYRNLACKLDVADRIVFTGPVSDQELPSHYLLGDVFVFPSRDRSEAFGIAALEAMSCGIPVVASNLPGVRTIVRHGQTGFLIKPGSLSALVSRIFDLVNDEDLCQKLGANGRTMAVTEYSELQRIDRWQKIINELFNAS